MQILSWNIQATRGCDGRDDVDRIANVIRDMGQADIICLQEVSRNFPEYGGNDQLALLSAAFPGYDPVWGPVVSWPGVARARKEFGNLTLVRRPLLLDWRVHPLPRPWPGTEWQMPRNAVEVVLAAGDRAIAVLNTHLAFHHEEERRQQALALTDIKNAILSWADQAKIRPAVSGPGAYAVLARPMDIILCGDLNLAAGSAQYQELVGSGGWQDVWQMLHDDRGHIATCGIHDARQWPEGPHCRDFFLVSPGIGQLSVDLAVDQETDASDHQPVMLTLIDQ